MRAAVPADAVRRFQPGARPADAGADRLAARARRRSAWPTSRVRNDDGKTVVQVRDGDGFKPRTTETRRAWHGAFAGARRPGGRRRSAAGGGCHADAPAERQAGARRRTSADDRRSVAMNRLLQRLPTIWREAIEELWRRRLRTLLTLLGLIFGVGAIVAMQAVGEGSRREALRLVESLGLHNLIAEARRAGRRHAQGNPRAQPGPERRRCRGRAGGRARRRTLRRGETGQDPFRVQRYRQQRRPGQRRQSRLFRAVFAASGAGPRVDDKTMTTASPRSRCSATRPPPACFPRAIRSAN